MTIEQRAMPLISVITPSYNSKRYIEETILSVLAQDYPHVEHIIVDGASTDGTVDILRRYTDRVRWVSEPDQGQSDALNKGLRIAQGEFLGWLNADDTFADSTVLSEVVGAFSKYPEAALVYAHCNIINDGGSKVGLSTAMPFDLESHVLTNLVPPVSAFWRRHVSDQVGEIDTRLHYVMDYEFWLRIARQMPVQQIDATWGNYRLSVGSKTTSNPLHFCEENLSVYDRFFNDPALPASIRNLRDRAYARTHWQTGLTLFQEAKNELGGLHCRRAVEEFGLIGTDAEYAVQMTIHWAFQSSGWGFQASNIDPTTFVHMILDSISDLPQVSREFKHRMLGNLYATRAFESNRNSRRSGVWYLAPLSWRYDSKWLTNLGLVSLWVESMAGTRITSYLRRLPSRFLLKRAR